MDIERYKAGGKAQSKVQKALADGQIERPEACELCGAIPKPIKVHNYGETICRSAIVGHHWKGYDHPLEVWFICNKCNLQLKGKRFHNGSVTKEAARAFILDRLQKKATARKKQIERSKIYQRYWPCKGLTLNGDQCLNQSMSGYCQYHKDQDPNYRG